MPPAVLPPKPGRELEGLERENSVASGEVVEPVWIEEEDRPAYAAALAAVRDSMSGVLTAAGRVLRDCGIEDVASVLGPLAHAVTDEALKASSVSAQRSVDPPSPHSR